MSLLTLCLLALARLKRRGAGAAVVVRGDKGRPLAGDIVGVITKRAIADAVIRNFAE